MFFYIDQNITWWYNVNVHYLTAHICARRSQMNIFRRTLCLTLSLCMALSLTAFAAPQTYEGEAKGFYDGLKVAVTINDGVIELVEVIENRSRKNTFFP